MYTNYFLNMWFIICYLILTMYLRNTFLQIEVIFNIVSTIYIISFMLNNFVLIFISRKLLMKYHDKILVTSFSVCSKNERFDNSSNIYYFLISYLAIIIVRIKDLNYLL